MAYLLTAEAFCPGIENRFLTLPSNDLGIPAPIAIKTASYEMNEVTLLDGENRFLDLPRLEPDTPPPVKSADQLLAQMIHHEDFRVSWLSKQKTKLALAATAASVGMTLIDSPITDTKDQILNAAKWMGPSLAAGEAVWIGGGAMMLAAIGVKVKNPFKIKKMIPEIADKANNSRLFNAGYLINTTAAMAEFGISTTGVMTEFPMRSWGLASFGFIDLAATYFVRRAIRRGIKNNIPKPDEKQTAQLSSLEI